jgi:hypothetical protein
MLNVKKAKDMEEFTDRDRPKSVMRGGMRRFREGSTRMKSVNLVDREQRIQTLKRI